MDTFNTSMDLQTKVKNWRESTAAIEGMGVNNDPRADKALKPLGELEGHVTGKAFAMGSNVFCLRTEGANCFTSQEVPIPGVF
jgi:hypothetical protein